jgi:hypothetical protein
MTNPFFDLPAQVSNNDDDFMDFFRECFKQSFEERLSADVHERFWTGVREWAESQTSSCRQNHRLHIIRRYRL